MGNATAVTTAMTKTQLYAEIAENTEVSKQDVGAVLDELAVIIGVKGARR